VDRKQPALERLRARRARVVDFGHANGTVLAAFAGTFPPAPMRGDGPARAHLGDSHERRLDGQVPPPPLVRATRRRALASRGTTLGVDGGDLNPPNSCGIYVTGKFRHVHLALGVVQPRLAFAPRGKTSGFGPASSCSTEQNGSQHVACSRGPMSRARWE
jgi:hypothetical protein